MMTKSNNKVFALCPETHVVPFHGGVGTNLFIERKNDQKEENENFFDFFFVSDYFDIFDYLKFNTEAPFKPQVQYSYNPSKYIQVKITQQQNTVFSTSRLVDNTNLRMPEIAYDENYTMYNAAINPTKYNELTMNCKNRDKVVF